MNRRTATAVIALFAACGGEPRDATIPDAAPAAPPMQQQGWTSAAGAIAFMQAREVDMTGDGSAERFSVTAAGPAWDSLAVLLVIRGAAGDTLWADRWQSTHYFKYLERDTMSAATVEHIVRGHIDAILADSSVHARGLPPAITASLHPTVRESVQYHLAELDWRGSADLEPGDPTPPQAYDRIAAATVPAERVDAVLQEIAAVPTFRWYAGGEVTSVIGWSAREQAFVRVFTCC